MVAEPRVTTAVNSKILNRNTIRHWLFPASSFKSVSMEPEVSLRGEYRSRVIRKQQKNSTMPSSPIRLMA